MSTANNDGQKVNRKLKYKELIEKGARIGDSLENQHVLESFKNILDLISVCENISTDYAREGKIEHTSDYLMDASIIKMSHDLMGSTAERMSENQFFENEYVAALLDIMTANQNDRLLDISVECCRTAHYQLSMLGTFSFGTIAPVEQKVKKERQAKGKLGIKKAPEKITQIVKVDKGAEKINFLRSEIERICKARKTTTIPYYELIIDPQNYMSTVDAAFQLSFLIRDGFMGLSRIDNEPHVIFKNSRATSATQADSSNTIQTIMSIDPPLWRGEIEKYNLKVPLLKLNLTETDSNDENDDTSEDD